MRAAVLTEFGAPLQILELQVPSPGPGQVLVRVMASGVNPLDTKIRRGQAAHAQTVPPAVLGIDMAGVVESVGDGVDAFRPGDEVFGMTGGVGGIQGSLAEFAAVDCRLLAPKPRTLSMKEAAALPLAFITAREALVGHAHIPDDASVLVHGGAGGVGHVAIQLARYRGAKVFATGGAASQEIITAAGATAIDYTTTTVAEYVEKHSAGDGFDVVFDTVGGSALDDSFAAVKRYTGHVVSALGWGTHSLAPLSFRAATYSGVFTLLPLLSGQHRDRHGRALRLAAEMADSGRLVPRLDGRTYTFANLDEAYAAVENHTANGKVVVQIASGDTTGKKHS
ncbi:zinc-dependent alcohol dehydrogenase family protein [Mycobacterium sp. 3519A]|uniref:zinc-dependent alcohol dehydrogenase family protein n=1 Tax=Mycobacterium sp. 3519A TaxID=2057184 RepID=UPI000C79713F|nr:zinc-dependent alcohol dehydrogenase family protein [Mycobacterium sp. 3519A]